MLYSFYSGECECGKWGKKQLSYYFLPPAVWKGEGRREGYFAPSAFGNLQNRGVTEVVEGDKCEGFLEAQSTLS